MATNELLICTACGTQFDVKDSTKLKACRICDDPRQFVPPNGQTWTTMTELKKEHRNKWEQDSVDEHVWSIWTEPKFGIGQRAMLLQTPHGNILWDLIALLDDDTVEFINSKGGLHAIVISHPHYYTTWAEWAKTFHCMVFLSKEDKEWICRGGNDGVTPTFMQGSSETILPGVTAVKTGGHFDGSLVLHWQNKLLIADTFVTVPSALYHIGRLLGTTSYSFMWSIPNMIPLPPSEIHKIWKALQPFDFNTTLGAFNGLNVRGKDVKGRVLESMKIQVKGMGYERHPLLDETWP